MRVEKRFFPGSLKYLSILSVISCLIMGLLFTPVQVKAEGGAGLPHLIQATSLKEDYQAMTELGLAYTPVLDHEDVGLAFENVAISCVRIQVAGHYGSGSIYRLLPQEIIVVTNQHVLQYWDEDSYLTFYNGVAAGGRLIGTDSNTDVGFISVSLDNFSWEQLLGMRNVRPLLSGGNVLTGRECLLVDMATDSTEPVSYQGHILEERRYLEDFRQEMLYGEGIALPGMSGSGIYDGFGNYLGMLTGGTLQGQMAGVPADVIQKVYEEIAGY